MAIRKRTRTVGKRKITSYQVEIWSHGQRITTKTFETKAAAAAWEENVKLGIIRPWLKPKSDPTLADITQKYVNSGFKELKKSSQQSRASRFRYILESSLADVEITKITPYLIDHWIQWLKKQPTTQNRNRKTFAQELKLLRVILNWYRNEHNHTYSVPVVRRHHKAVIFKENLERPHDYFIAPEKIGLWLQELKKRPDPVYYQVALTMILTGMRLGEATGLCWDCIHFQDDAVKIRVIRTLTWDYSTKEPYFQESTKTKSSIRTIKADKALIEVFQSIKKNQQALRHPKKPVFLNSRGSLLRDNTVRKNFDAAFKASGLQWSGTHIARHTFATLALMSHSSLSQVQAVLGHKHQNITEGYAKVAALQESPVSAQVAEQVGIHSQSKDDSL